MNITPGQIYRHNWVQPGGPAEGHQPVNRHRVVSVTEDRVVTLSEEPGSKPVDRDRASFEEQFELIA